MKLIYAIPGLGTTKELFKNISIPGHTLKVLEWPSPQSGWDLKKYSQAFLSQIDTSSAVNLIGVSFGGMICSELADLVKVNIVVVISSSKNKIELPTYLKLLRHLPLQKFLSEKNYLALASRSRLIIGFEKNDMPGFLEMLGSMPANYFKYCFGMILNWNRNTNSGEIHHIHGNKDKLLPHTFIKNYTLVEGGNHAMIVYKAREINVLLNTLFNGL